MSINGDYPTAAFNFDQYADPSTGGAVQQQEVTPENIDVFNTESTTADDMDQYRTDADRSIFYEADGNITMDMDQAFDVTMEEASQEGKTYENNQDPEYIKDFSQNLMGAVADTYGVELDESDPYHNEKNPEAAQDYPQEIQSFYGDFYNNSLTDEQRQEIDDKLADGHKIKDNSEDNPLRNDQIDAINAYLAQVGWDGDMSNDLFDVTDVKTTNGEIELTDEAKAGIDKYGSESVIVQTATKAHDKLMEETTNDVAKKATDDNPDNNENLDAAKAEAEKEFYNTSDGRVFHYYTTQNASEASEVLQNLKNNGLNTDAQREKLDEAVQEKGTPVRTKTVKDDSGENVGEIRYFADGSYAEYSVNEKGEMQVESFNA